MVVACSERVCKEMWPKPSPRPFSTCCHGPRMYIVRIVSSGDDCRQTELLLQLLHLLSVSWIFTITNSLPIPIPQSSVRLVFMLTVGCPHISVTATVPIPHPLTFLCPEKAIAIAMSRLPLGWGSLALEL